MNAIVASDDGVNPDKALTPTNLANTGDVSDMRQTASFAPTYAPNGISGSVNCPPVDDLALDMAISTYEAGRSGASIHHKQILHFLNELRALRSAPSAWDDTYPRIIKERDDLLAALKECRAAMSSHPAFQGREYVQLGILVNDAIAKAQP